MKFIVLLLALAGAFSMMACSTSSKPDQSLAEKARIELEVGTAVAQLASDPARYSTQSFEWHDVARDRAVPVRLYFPAGATLTGKLPLVVFSHGIGGSRDGYKYLGRHFAANGYLSLHVQHVGSDRQVWRGNPLGLLGRLTDAAKDEEAIQRARDLSFALNQFLAGEFAQHVDPQRIIAAGHSYGANTSMLVAGATLMREGQPFSLRDHRIRAAILISAPPFYGAGDTDKILGDIGIPTLHITATEDDIEIPGYRSGVDDRLAVYRAMGQRNAGQKSLVVFKGGSHSIFTDRLGTGGVTLNPKVKLATRDLALAFLNKMAQDDSDALQRWSEQYAPLLSRFENVAAP